jgi:glycosyltransferase involved in cell wall biosynthesis
MNLFFDTRWFGDHGIGRFAREVYARLPDVREFSGSLKPSSPFDCAYLSHRLSSLPKNSTFFSPGYNAPLLRRVPLIFTIHDLMHIEFAGSRNRLHRSYYEHVTKPACHHAKAVLTVSEYSRGRIAEWSGLDATRIVNVGNGIDDCFHTTGESFVWPQPYIFCVGNRRPHKNEARTLQAFGMIAGRVPHDLIFIGPPSESLLSDINRAGLQTRVHFLGRVSDQQLASVYRGAKALAFVSLYEGFGLPVIEAMACGTPVVTSNLSSLPEVAGGAALLVDPYSCEEIAHALERAVSDGPLAADLVRRGLVNIQRYSWSRTGEAVRTVIDERMWA